MKVVCWVDCWLMIFLAFFLDMSSNKDIYKGYGIGKLPVETTGEVVKN